jgi:predicted ATPase
MNMLSNVNVSSGRMKMEIKLKGVGALPETALSVNGITVITGVNNTGKSTIMKSIFVLADAAANLDDDMQREVLWQAESIYRMFARGQKKTMVTLEEFLSAIKEQNPQKVKSILNEMMPKKELESTSSRLPYSKYYEERSKYVIDFSSGSLDRQVFLKRFIKDNILAEFKDQIRNVKTDEPAHIHFTLDGVDYGMSINEKEEVELHGDILNYGNRVVYIDTPYLFDRIEERLFHHPDDVENHADKLVRTLNTGKDNSAIGRISIDERKKDIDKLLKGVLGGTFRQGKRGMLYVANGTELSVKNLATGMKTFSLIKLLIESGGIGEGSIILMDEPEAHVHPEWQLVLAEILVLLSKNMGISTVVSTHSPQMLLALEAFSMEHDVSANYYNTQRDEKGRISIENVNRMLEKVYGPMADAYAKADRIYLSNFERKNRNE